MVRFKDKVFLIDKFWFKIEFNMYGHILGDVFIQKTCWNTKNSKHGFFKGFKLIVLTGYNCSNFMSFLTRRKVFRKCKGVTNENSYSFILLISSWEVKGEFIDTFIYRSSSMGSSLEHPKSKIRLRNNNVLNFFIVVRYYFQFIVKSLKRISSLVVVLVPCLEYWKGTGKALIINVSGTTPLKVYIHFKGVFLYNSEDGR